MSLSRRILVRWVQLAALATALTLMVYIVFQQTGRQTANDPQIQLARDAAAALSAGAPVESVIPATQVDIGKSLGPWVTVLSDSGTVIASSARLHGQMQSVPAGVVDHARQSGEERVTWQPEHGSPNMAARTWRPNGDGNGSHRRRSDPLRSRWLLSVFLS